MQLDMILKLIKPFISQMPDIKIISDDKANNGLTVNGKFISFADLETQLEQVRQ